MSKILVDELVNLGGNDKVTFTEGAKIATGETLELDGATITLDTGVGLNNQILASTGTGLQWVTFTTLANLSDTDSSYTFTVDKVAVDDIKLKLTGFDAAVGQLDQITFTGQGSVSIDENANVITITGIDTNTTYDITVDDITDGASLTLAGSDSTSDVVEFVGGTNIDIVRSGSTFTFSTQLSGTVSGPGSTTDNAVALFDGTTGALLKNSPLTVAANGDVTGINDLTVNDITVNTITVPPQTGNKLTFWYADVASFPSATTYEGSFAYSDANATMHYAAGNSWYQVAKLSDIQQDTNTTYSLGMSGTTNGTLTLQDSNGITDTVSFQGNVHGGINLIASGQNLYFDGATYSVSAETSSGNRALLRLTKENHDLVGNVTSGTSDDLVIAGADGLTVERTDANTITLRQGAANVTQYTDSEAKDAAAQSLLNGTHTNISFTYDSVNKIMSATATGAPAGGQGTGEVAVGSIMMWSGTVATIPTGWQLCDGTNSSPDLRNRFIVGAASDSGTGVTFDATNGALSGDYAPGATGGSIAHQLTVDEMPEHSHTENAWGFQHTAANPGPGGAGTNVANATTGVEGSDHYHENRPPYYALCFIYCTTAISGGGGGGSSTPGTLYDLYGTNTTSNNVILNLDPASGAIDQVEFAGGGDTTISWDSVNKRATISSTAPVNADWNATTGLAQILNKPSIPAAYTLPAATTSTLGGVIPDGTTITVDANGNIAAAPGGYTLPTSSATVLGGIKIGSGLSIDAGGVVSVASGGSVGLQTRQDFTGTTASIADNATGDLNITAYKAYTLLKVETSEDAWVRIYTDAASRTADANRSEGSDPSVGTGVIAETRGSGVVLISPGVFGYNNDSPSATDTVYAAVTNRSGASRTITVTLTAIRLEA
tara:strand:+ start:1604 stop:4276 length:2673 start_codon:yes stop_codon:yes gene_type:complete